MKTLRTKKKKKSQPHLCTKFEPINWENEPTSHESFLYKIKQSKDRNKHDLTIISITLSN